MEDRSSPALLALGLLVQGEVVLVLDPASHQVLALALEALQAPEDQAQALPLALQLILHHQVGPPG